MLLVCEYFENNQAEIYDHEGEIRALDLGVELRREQNRIYGRSQQKQEDALDKGDKGPVEYMEQKRSDILAKDFPTTGLA